MFHTVKNGATAALWIHPVSEATIVSATEVPPFGGLERRAKRGGLLNLAITRTFLELGDATSRNLEFSHCDDVWVSYGEETITETNLLGIRRRHPALVRIRMFPKLLEAKNGADWEWHVVGRRRTLRMRVQAKRVQRNGVLKVKHVVKSSRKQ